LYFFLAFSLFWDITHNKNLFIIFFTNCLIGAVLERFIAIQIGIFHKGFEEENKVTGTEIFRIYVCYAFRVLGIGIS
jgi:hypothetical protein